jgi:hypothetical protein
MKKPGSGGVRNRVSKLQIYYGGRSDLKISTGIPESVLNHLKTYHEIHHLRKLQGRINSPITPI